MLNCIIIEQILKLIYQIFEFALFLREETNVWSFLELLAIEK
jgi:hypothetical protein